MTRATSLLPALILTTAVLGSPGCEKRDLDRVGTPGTPAVVLLSPQHAGTPEARKDLEAYLGKETGLAVRVRAADSAAAALNLVDTRRADAALLPVFEYLFCHEAFGARAALQVVRRGVRRGYAGQVLTLTQGPKTPADLDGKRFAFVDPYSTSGFVLPAKLLHDAGAHVEPVFAGSHEKALSLLEKGKVAGAAVHDALPVRDGRVKVVARTAEIPNEPVFFRKDLEAEVARKLAEALLSFGGTEAGRAALATMGDVSGFAPVDDTTYAPVRSILDDVGKQVQDLVPQGWRIYNESRSSPADYAQ